MDKLRRKKYVIGSTDGRAETSKPFDSGLGTRGYGVYPAVFRFGFGPVFLHCTPVPTLYSLVTYLLL